MTKQERQALKEVGTWVRQKGFDRVLKAIIEVGETAEGKALRAKIGEKRYAELVEIVSGAAIDAEMGNILSKLENGTFLSELKGENNA